MLELAALVIFQVVQVRDGHAEKLSVATCQLWLFLNKDLLVFCVSEERSGIKTGL